MLTERLEYLKNRQNFIGGSDVAAAMGISKWKTRLQLYLEKTAETPIDITSEKMQMGNELEPYILKRFLELPEIKENYYNPKLKNNQFTSNVFEVIKASPDTTLYELKQENQKLIPVDAKNAECHFKAYADWEISIDYYAQVQAQIHVTGAEYGFLVVLFNGWHLEYYKIDKNDTFINQMIESCKDFWFNYVKAGIMPEPSTNEEANQYYEEQGSSIEATYEMGGLIKVYKTIKSELEKLEEEKKGIELELKKYLGENTILTIGGEPVIKWKYNKDSTKFNAKKYLLENEVDINYFTTTKGNRVFKLLGEKE